MDAPSNHVDVLEISVVLAGFKEEDLNVRVFSQSTGHDTPGGASSVCLLALPKRIETDRILRTRR